MDDSILEKIKKISEAIPDVSLKTILSGRMTPFTTIREIIASELEREEAMIREQEEYTQKKFDEFLKAFEEERQNAITKFENEILYGQTGTRRPTGLIRETVPTRVKVPGTIFLGFGSELSVIRFTEECKGDYMRSTIDEDILQLKQRTEEEAEQESKRICEEMGIGKKKGKSRDRSKYKKNKFWD